MARRGKPLGNKRQREQAKARKKRDKEARREARKDGTPGEEESADDQEEDAEGTDSPDGEAHVHGPEDLGTPATEPEGDTERERAPWSGDEEAPGDPPRTE